MRLQKIRRENKKTIEREEKLRTHREKEKVDYKCLERERKKRK